MRITLLFKAIVIFCLSVPASYAKSDHSVKSMRTFLANMPKAELHLHLEGTLSPETIVEFTRRNGIRCFTTTIGTKTKTTNI